MASTQRFHIGERVQIVKGTSKPRRDGRSVFVKRTVGAFGSIEACGWFDETPGPDAGGFQYFVRMEMDRALQLIHEDWLRDAEA